MWHYKNNHPSHFFQLFCYFFQGAGVNSATMNVSCWNPPQRTHRANAIPTTSLEVEFLVDLEFFCKWALGLPASACRAGKQRGTTLPQPPPPSRAARKGMVIGHICGPFVPDLESSIFPHPMSEFVGASNRNWFWVMWTKVNLLERDVELTVCRRLMHWSWGSSRLGCGNDGQDLLWGEPGEWASETNSLQGSLLPSHHFPKVHTLEERYPLRYLWGRERLRRLVPWISLPPTQNPVGLR